MLMMVMVFSPFNATKKEMYYNYHQEVKKAKLKNNIVSFNHCSSEAKALAEKQLNDAKAMAQEKCVLQ